MTDNKIIELLEGMIKKYHSGFAAEILALINRQKAEIERLKECPKCVYEYRGELTEYCVQGPCSNFKPVDKIKSEAYKEFAERLKRSTVTTVIGNEIYAVATSKCVDNLVKELEGVTNDY